MVILARDVVRDMGHDGVVGEERGTEEVRRRGRGADVRVDLTDSSELVTHGIRSMTRQARQEQRGTRAVVAERVCMCVCQGTDEGMSE